MNDPNATTAPSSPGGSARVALASVFLSPTRSFQEIARGATWLLPFAITAILGIAAGWMQMPLQDAVMQQRMSQLSDAQREAAASHAGTVQTFRIIGLAAVPVTLLAALVVAAGLFFLVLRAGGANVGFKPALRGLAYANVIPWGIGGLLGGVLLQLKARSTELTGMGDMPRMGLDLLGGEGLLRGVLSAFNPFSIWWLVVAVYGFAVLTGRKPGKVAPLVLVAGILWLVLGGLASGFGFARGSS